MKTTLELTILRDYRCEEEREDFCPHHLRRWSETVFGRKSRIRSDAVLKRLVIRLQDGAARILPTARVDTKAFAFLPTLLRGFRQVIPRARGTFFPTESAECKNFAEMVRAYAA